MTVKNATERESARVLFARDRHHSSNAAIVLTEHDEARRIALNIARLPELLGKA